MRLQTMMINEYGLNCCRSNIKVCKHLLKQCEETLGAGATAAVPNHVPVEEKPAQ